jgi:hypothetical protein
MDVARKIHRQNGNRNQMAIAALRLRSELGMQCAVGPVPRVQRVPITQWRLPVTIISEPSQPVEIIHVGQNLGSTVTGIQRVQNQYV